MEDELKSKPQHTRHNIDMYILSISLIVYVHREAVVELSQQAQAEGVQGAHGDGTPPLSRFFTVTRGGGRGGDFMTKIP